MPTRVILSGDQSGQWRFAGTLSALLRTKLVLVFVQLNVVQQFQILKLEYRF